MIIDDIQAIDWNLSRQQVRRQCNVKEKKEEEWDNRADSFAKRTASSVYIDTFIKRLAPSPSLSILDVGSGPGTLAIPLARRVKAVTCLDFSKKMLNIAQMRARQLSLNNLAVCKAGWKDDWQRLGIERHDIALASRALAVDDLKSALLKLCAFANKKVVVTDKVGQGPYDPFAFKALDRPLKTGPDYIYTVNLLYQLGYQATVDFIRIKENREYDDLEDALDSYNWMFPNQTGDEKIRLKKYIQSITSVNPGGKITFHRPHTPTWAYICWSPDEKVR